MCPSPDGKPGSEFRKISLTGVLWFFFNTFTLDTFLPVCNFEP